jgi:hypothetical protein
MTLDQYLDALLALPMFYDAAISRDGTWAAWTWWKAGPTADVYVAPTDGSAPPTRLTHSAENTVLVSWAPDSQSVLVRQDQGGDERVRLFRVDLERPGMLQPLTEESPNYFLRGGQLHPNGRWLVYGANVDQAGAEIEPTWLYRHDLATGERRALARPAKGGYYEPDLNEQGTHIFTRARTCTPPATRSGWSTSTGATTARSSTSARRRKLQHHGCPMAGARWCWPRPRNQAGFWRRFGASATARCSGLHGKS